MILNKMVKDAVADTSAREVFIQMYDVVKAAGNRKGIADMAFKFSASEDILLIMSNILDADIFNSRS